MASAVPLLAANGKGSRKKTIVKAAWQLENAVMGKVVDEYPEDIQAARQLHYDILRLNKWYYGALVCLVILTFWEVPTWCHKDKLSQSVWSWHPGSDMCIVPSHDGKKSNPYLSGIWYLPPGFALIIEIVIEVIVLWKFTLDYQLEHYHFAPVGQKFQDTKVIFCGAACAIGSILDTAVFTLFTTPIRFTFLFRTGLIFLSPGVQSLFYDIFNRKMLGEFMSISMFLWGTILFFAWISVTIFGSINEVSYLEDGKEPVFVNKDLDTLSGAFYSMFVAAVTGEFVDVFLPTLIAYRSSGLLWLTFLILAKILFENVTLDTLVSAYIIGANKRKEHVVESRAKGSLAAFNTLCSLGGEQAGDGAGQAIPKDTWMEFTNVFGRSPVMKLMPSHVAELLWHEAGPVDATAFCKLTGVLESEVLVHPLGSPLQLESSEWGSRLCEAVLEPKEAPAFDNLMNSILLVNMALVLIESAYNLNDWGDPPAWTDYIELVFSFVYLGEVLVKVSVKSWDVYWLTFANRFDFFTTVLLLFSSVLQALPNSVLPFDLSHYANILRLLRLLRVLKQLKSLKSVQFLAGMVQKMVATAGNILLLLGTVVFFFTTLSVNLFGGVLYEGNPKLEETEYEEKHWFVFNFNDVPMGFALYFTQLLCEYVPTNAEALQKASQHGDIAWLIFPCFYFIGVAIMFEILLSFTIDTYIELREDIELMDDDGEGEEKPSHHHEEGDEHEGHGGHEGHGAHGAHGEHEGHGGHEEHGHHGGHEKESEYDEEEFFEELQEDLEKEGQMIHFVSTDEPCFPNMLEKEYGHVIHKGHKGEHDQEHSHAKICKAAWQFENAIYNVTWARYPKNIIEARDYQLELYKMDKLYYRAIIGIVIITFWEVPAWCHELSSEQDLWTFLPGTEWCQTPPHAAADSNLFLSGLWYLPPGIALIAEVICEIIMFRKFMMEITLEKTHFADLRVWSAPVKYTEHFAESVCKCLGREPIPADKIMTKGGEIAFKELQKLEGDSLKKAFPIKVEQGVKYHDHRLIYAGLFCAFGSIIDTLVFTFVRMPMRFTWFFRTGLLFILPGVQRIYTCIFNRQMLGELGSVAIFFVGAVIFFAWVAVTIFKDLNDVAFTLGEEQVLANKGLGTLREAIYSLFVAGIGEGFVDNFLPAFSAYRASGLLWLVFLCIGQMLLLNLVIDAFVSAYLKQSEEALDERAEAQAESVYAAFKTLSVDGKSVSKDLFLEFVADLGKSPRMPMIAQETADAVFTQFGEVTKEKFLDACHIIQNPLWQAPRDSFVKTSFPGLWESKGFTWLRDKVWNPKELSAFDSLMNTVLMANLVLVLLQSAYDLNNWGNPPFIMQCLDIFFAFAYVGEVLVKLSVKSWDEYNSFVANKFDFATTWFLLFTTMLPFLPFDFVQGDLKRYANILRLFRLVRVVKQLKQVPSVQFMILTISRMVNAAGDILQLLGVTLFFFSAFCTNCFGGILYQGIPELAEMDYGKKNWYVFNFNDMTMAFVTFFNQLLSEFVPETAEALEKTSKIGYIAWYIFPLFYVVGVAIIFEIAKAFTIEYYLAIKEEQDEEEEESDEEEEEEDELKVEGKAQLELLKKLEDKLAEHNQLLTCQLRNDSFTFQHEVAKALQECLEEEEHGHEGGHEKEHHHH
eukprot:TRINITY_DN27155_c0_g1_i1.p1 TRINITY_DN27155_c0_g1~~TRINITY_DN27155_c0_g1_i1.p1  ORF type:complete len:1643 (+),score=374.49 TRINITY_DN27155_c0_g1_i1:111-5039(+)